MTANATHLQAYLKTWDKHREIWEIKKDPFIRRYERLNPPVSSFDADIARCLFHSVRLSHHSSCLFLFIFDRCWIVIVLFLSIDLDLSNDVIHENMLVFVLL